MRSLSRGKIKIVVVLGFFITTICISTIISAIFIDVKYTVSENDFNRNWNILNINLDKMKSLEEISGKLEKDSEIFLTTQNVDFITLNNKDYINKIMGISKKTNVENFVEIEWKDGGQREFNEKKEGVVVGSTLVNELKEEGKEEYIEIKGEKHKIVGIIKDSQYLSFSTFMPIEKLREYEEETDIISLYIPIELERSLESLKNVNYNITKIEDKKIIKEVLNRSMTIKEDIFDFGISIIIIIIFGIFLVYARKRDFSIMRLLGAKPKDILIENIKELMPVYIIGWGIGIIVAREIVNYIILNIDSIFYKVDLLNILLTFGIGFILTVVTSTLCMYKALRFKMLEDIK